MGRHEGIERRERKCGTRDELGDQFHYLLDAPNSEIIEIYF